MRPPAVEYQDGEEWRPCRIGRAVTAAEFTRDPDGEVRPWVALLAGRVIVAYTPARKSIHCRLRR